MLVNWSDYQLTVALAGFTPNSHDFYIYDY